MWVMYAGKEEQMDSLINPNFDQIFAILIVIAGVYTLITCLWALLINKSYGKFWANLIAGIAVICFIYYQWGQHQNDNTSNLNAPQATQVAGQPLNFKNEYFSGEEYFLLPTSPQNHFLLSLQRVLFIPLS